jgi:hypothetical protein
VQEKFENKKAKEERRKKRRTHNTQPIKGREHKMGDIEIKKRTEIKKGKRCKKMGRRKSKFT